MHLNLGIGGAVQEAQVFMLYHNQKSCSCPVGMKAGAVALGGIMGRSWHCDSSAVNTRVQDKLNPTNNTSNNNSNTSNDGPYGEAKFYDR